MELTDQQTAAAQVPGSVMVTAGPGTGKTRTLAERVQHLLRDQDPADITVVTFTRSAAAELATRLGDQVVAALDYCGTLHGLAYRHQRHLDLATEDEAREVFDQIADLESRKAQEIARAHRCPGSRLERRWSDQVTRTLGYEGKTSMDDMLRGYCAMLARGTAEAPRHLLVDEIQDACEVDWDIYRQAETLFGVGDPWQSIYGFRGANPDLFSQACQTYRCLELSVNFRSTAAVVEASNAIADRDQVTADGADPGQATDWHLDTEAEQWDLVARDIGSRTGTQAVLCRTNAQAAEARQALKSRGIRAAGQAKRQSLLRALIYAHTRPDSAKAAQHLAIQLRMPLAAGEARETWRRLGFGDHVERDEVVRAAPESLKGAIRKAPAHELIGILDEAERPQGEVLVQTVHAAKGAEYDHVYVPGVTLDRYPAESPEERRILYVAVTRARETVQCYAPDQEGGHRKSSAL